MTLKPTSPSSLQDPWISKYSMIDPAKLHALGVIGVWWNACETHLIVIFMYIAKLEAHPAWIIAHDMGDIALSERILEIAKSNNEDGELSDEIVDYIKHLLKAYDLCRQNRNTFTHFKTTSTKDGSWKFIRMKGPSMLRQPLPDDLADFRRVADELANLAGTLRRFSVCLEERSKGKQTPLPEKLPLPQLVWKPPQQGPKARKPQRRSSQV